MAYPARDIVLSSEPRSPRQPGYVRRVDYDPADDNGPVVFLDLDNTLISAIDERSLSSSQLESLKRRYGHYKRISPYIVFPRLHLDYFLTKLFASYRVGVWTAASKDYAHRVVKEFVIRPDPDSELRRPNERPRVLETFLWRDHTNFLTSRGWGFKDLRALTAEFGYSASMDDSYIVDDNELVWTTQPERTIRVRPFEATDADQGGDTLLRVLDLLDSTVRYGIGFDVIGEPGL